MAAAQVHSGGCLCGAVRYEVRAELPLYVCICHCQSCRKAVGGGMVPWVTFRSADVTMLGEALAERSSSPGVTRGHCARCGTSISYRHERRQGQIDLTLASMDHPGSFTPVAHIWVEDKLPWLGIDDGLPRYQKTVSAGADPE
jgi:hypothetical protein